MVESSKGMSIMEMYKLYRENKFLVNRRYQRKLVWSIKEKQSLIDSVFKKYPIPLILLASTENDCYEIIDGIQRLNALFGFIENQFPILKDKNELFFSVKDYPTAQTAADNGLFQPNKTNNISQAEVAEYISYPVPVTIFKTKNIDDIDETFRRINAYGKHLSNQEVRQAGNTSQFSQIIRELASELRGDATKNILLLSEMPEISIDSKATSLGYRINAEDIFWCKQGIIKINDLRESEDEQILADLILSTVLSGPLPASKDEFDNYFGNGSSDKSREIEIKIKEHGRDNIKSSLKIVFSEIHNFCTYLTTENIRLKNLLNPKARANPVKEDFYTLFMAFYNLIILNNKIPFDFTGIESAVDNVHKKLTRASHHISTNDRQKNINAVIGLIQMYFKDSDKPFRSSTSYTIDFQAHLSRSKVESPVYDFKQGLYTLDPKKRILSDKTFEESIICNIAALSNLGAGKRGYLFIGVTDKEADTIQVEKLDGLINVQRYNGFGVVGLEREAKLRGVTLDQYIQLIVKKIADSDLPEDLKSKVTKSVTPITYFDMTVLMIEVVCGTAPTYYKELMYAREGSSCVKIEGSKQASIFNLFMKS